MPDEPRSLRDILEGVVVAFVWQRHSTKHLRWTAADKALLLELRLARASFKEIAQRLGPKFEERTCATMFQFMTTCGDDTGFRKSNWTLEQDTALWQLQFDCKVGPLVIGPYLGLPCEAVQQRWTKIKSMPRIGPCLTADEQVALRMQVIDASNENASADENLQDPCLATALSNEDDALTEPFDDALTDSSGDDSQSQSRNTPGMTTASQRGSITTDEVSDDSLPESLPQEKTIPSPSQPVDISSRDESASDDDSCDIDGSTRAMTARFIDLNGLVPLKKPFTSLESHIFEAAIKKHGHKWPMIAASMPKRSEKDCMSHHYFKGYKPKPKAPETKTKRRASIMEVIGNKRRRIGSDVAVPEKGSDEGTPIVLSP